MSRPRLVVLDGFTLAPIPAPPGEPDWHRLGELGDLVVHARTAPAEVLERSEGADALFTNKVVLDRELLSALPGLRYVGVLATGTNVVDLQAASELGLTVTNVPGYSTDSVAQHVFALLLELVGSIGDHDRAVHEGAWVDSPDFTFRLAQTRELAGLTLGLVGLGAIGRKVATIALAFGMRVLAVASSRPRAIPDPVGVERLPLRMVLELSDVLSLHCPLTPETHHLIDAERLSWMRPGALLINTGRGPLVEPAAVSMALRTGQLGGLATDVLEREPPLATEPLLDAPNCVITPHIAWATREARARLLTEVIENYRAFREGTPRNVVAGPPR